MSNPSTGKDDTRAIDEVHEQIGSLAETLKTECPIRPPLVEQHISRGDIVTMAARPGTGKTPLMSQLGICVATGTPFLGSATHVSKVAMFDLESHAAGSRQTLITLAGGLGVDQGELGKNLHLFVRGNPRDPNSRELDRVLANVSHLKDRIKWLENIIREQQYGLIILDTALALFPVNSSDERHVRGVMGNIQSLRLVPPYPAIVLVVHLRKRDKQFRPPSLLEDPYGWTEEMLGSVVWSASADVRLGMEWHEDDGLRVFGGFRRGYGEVAPMILQPHVGDEGQPLFFELIPPGAAFDAVLTPALSSAMLKLPVHEWITFKGMVERGVAKSTAHRLIHRASAAGLLECDKAKSLYRRRQL